LFKTDIFESRKGRFVSNIVCRHWKILAEISAVKVGGEEFDRTAPERLKGDHLLINPPGVVSVGLHLALSVASGPKRKSNRIASPSALCISADHERSKDC
jgi:hypothetical protein